MGIGTFPRGIQRDRMTARARVALLALAGVAVLVLWGASAAFAADQFTLDSQAQSFGPVVVDQSGNGYVAWLSKGGPSGEIDMFCRLAPGARKCADPITLPVTTYEATSTDTPFPVLGPDGDVFVVAPDYASGQDVIWESTNGGSDFGAPYVSPSNGQEAPGSGQTNLCGVAPNLDDVLPINAYGGQYDPSQGTSTLEGGGGSNIEFNMSSNDPGAVYGFDYYDGGCSAATGVIPPGAGPGAAPFKVFGFGGSSSPFVQQTTLGWATGGTAACSRVVPGDEVEAYETAQDTPAIQFYRWSAPTGPCMENPNDNLGTELAGNWHGPGTVTTGVYPRLAGGKSGLFLLTGDSLTSEGAPSAIDIRQYDVASHGFGSPKTVSHISGPSSLEANSGGLGESFTTGELATVWPNIKGDDHLMNLFISTNGGSRFSAAVPIARVSSGYSDGDNARVAVAPNGTGFVTWSDANGLEVADLKPLASTYGHLKHHRGTIEVPVTCEAATGKCKVIATITRAGKQVAGLHRKVGSGLTLTLHLPLVHGHLKGKLKLTIITPGAATIRLSVRTVI